MAEMDSRRFAGRVALVTGAASGIGREAAAALAAAGAAVCRADIAADWDERTNEQYRLDVTAESQWEAVVRRIVASHGQLDILVNCAGISAAGTVAETDYAQWRRVFAVNLDGTFLGTKHGIQAMRAQGGSIVNVSSASAIRAASGAAAYSASKAAVCMLSRTAAKECRDAGLAVRVNTVCPGGVKTPLWRTMPFFRELVEKTGSEEKAFEAMAQGVPGGRFAEPADIVQAILFLASNEARFVTGVDLAVDGGYVL